MQRIHLPTANLMYKNGKLHSNGKLSFGLTSCIAQMPSVTVHNLY